MHNIEKDVRIAQNKRKNLKQFLGKIGFDNYFQGSHWIVKKGINFLITRVEILKFA